MPRSPRSPFLCAPLFIFASPSHSLVCKKCYVVFNWSNLVIVEYLGVTLPLRLRSIRAALTSPLRFSLSQGDISKATRHNISIDTSFSLLAASSHLQSIL